MVAAIPLTFALLQRLLKALVSVPSPLLASVHLPGLRGRGVLVLLCCASTSRVCLGF